MENLEICPVCNTTIFLPFITCEDFSISKELFAIQQCTQCKFLFTNPRPNSEEIGRYYDSNVYISHHADKSGFIPWLYRTIRNRQFINKTTIIKQHFTNPSMLLDIGCGTGDFLNYCSTLGWKTVGVEPDEDARKQANTKQTTVYPTTYLNSTQEKFDVITLWHVLEHVHNLEERLQQLNNLINHNGIVIIAVPNPASHDAQYYNKYWAAYDVPRHLYHFTKDSIAQLFSKHQFHLHAVHPMKYDAFYVSIKSEEYKTKNNMLFNFINGALRGFLSNINAIKTNEYSSAIYVFKKK